MPEVDRFDQIGQGKDLRITGGNRRMCTEGGRDAEGIGVRDTPLGLDRRRSLDKWPVRLLILTFWRIPSTWEEAMLSRPMLELALLALPIASALFHHHGKRIHLGRWQRTTQGRGRSCLGDTNVGTVLIHHARVRHREEKGDTIQGTASRFEVDRSGAHGTECRVTWQRQEGGGL